MKILKNLAKSLSILGLLITGFVYAEGFPTMQIDENNPYNGQSGSASAQEAIQTVNATDPGGPGDPQGLPINDYAYVLFAAGAGLAVYAARKKKMAI